jgi:hypothetical protein
MDYESEWSNAQWYIRLDKMNIYDANGTKIADGPRLRWENIDPSSASVTSGATDPLGQQVTGRWELTPFGSEVSFDPPELPDEPPDNLPQTTPEMGSIEAEYTAMCTLNGIDMLCRDVMRAMQSGECEYASCSIQDSHGDYIFDAEAEFGPSDSRGNPCKGFQGGPYEACLLGLKAFF